MTVDQIYQLVNTATAEALGTTTVQVAEDLSNLVDVGDTVFANVSGVDNYVRKLIDRIGRLVYTDRVYSSGIDLTKDAWEFGSILEKIRVNTLPAAQQNDSWTLTPGQTYDPNVFTAPDVEVAFYNKKETYEIAMSFTEEQIKESFRSAEEMNRFVSMIYTMIANSFAVKFEEIELRLIDSAIADTVYDDYSGGSLSASSGVKAVNLLYLYNQTVPTPITASDCLYSPEFLRFAIYTIGMYSDRMVRMSTLFNIDAKPRFTPKANQKVIFHSDFANAVKANLLSDVYHDEYLKLPEDNRHITPYWQGTGTTYAYADTSKIDVKSGDGHTQAVDNIFGVLFDDQALLVCNDNRRVTTNYNGRAEFINYWYKYDINMINAQDENFVVFFAA